MAQLVSLLLLAVMIFSIVDAITSDSWRVRYMPKVAWVLLIVFLPLIGSILWLALGKDRQRSAPSSFDRPSAAIAPDRSTTESELAAVEREIVFHEKQAEIRRLEAKLQARKTDPTA
ncbi:MAG: PLDc_N domain-containing protein [Salinibacterium sp.]|nr:PLDc_N domain-containing protein [Salinibacterium sp.]